MSKSLETTKQDTQVLAAQVGDYVRGYGRHDREALMSLIAYREWAVLAQRELDARATRFISVFSNDELEAIARGDVNLSEVARGVLKELHGGRP